MLRLPCWVEIVEKPLKIKLLVVPPRQPAHQYRNPRGCEDYEAERRRREDEPSDGASECLESVIKVVRRESTPRSWVADNGRKIIFREAEP